MSATRPSSPPGAQPSLGFEHYLTFQGCGIARLRTRRRIGAAGLSFRGKLRRCTRSGEAAFGQRVPPRLCHLWFRHSARSEPATTAREGHAQGRSIRKTPAAAPGLFAPAGRGQPTRAPPQRSADPRRAVSGRPARHGSAAQRRNGRNGCGPYRSSFNAPRSRKRMVRSMASSVVSGSKRNRLKSERLLWSKPWVTPS